VTSARKIEANRTNAKASTGPKTRRGRARSANNALQHGLSLPLRAHSHLYEEACTLADRIAGPGAGADVNLLSLRVAEARIDLDRVRVARQSFLSQRRTDTDVNKDLNMSLEEAEGLLRIDRYERRARSRLKFAIRDLDEAKCLLIGK
jgi:hypothetical protein